MIAFVVAVADEARFRSVGGPSIDRAREADSVVMELRSAGGLQTRLNAALDELAPMPDLEAAVIVHEDVELCSPDAAARIRQAFADPAVAIAGAFGARGVRSLAWWEGRGVGAVRSLDGRLEGDFESGPVDAVDGLLLALSPWAVRNLRFAEDMDPDFHGYDIELCFQARYHGRSVVSIPLDVEHHHRPLFHDVERWVRNELRFQRRWFDHRLISLRRHRALHAPARE